MISAQEAAVPHTRTFPGIASPALPYARPEEVGLSSEKLERLGDEIVSWVAAGELVGAELLIVKDGRAVFHEAYGWSDREERKPVKRNSIWSIKSMSKPFTAMAVLMLAEEGKLSLDDRVSRYIPGFAGYPGTTIHHLLSHTSGYREEVGDPAPIHESFRHWVEDWAAKTPTGTLGEFWYTDFGFAAAGYIVEAVSGLPIGRFTEERIVAPLRLEDTGTNFSDDLAWRARLNPFYWFQEDRYELRHPASRPAWRFYPAAWGMFSTAMDYAQFLGLWMNGGEWRGTRLLSEETVDTALRPHGKIDDETAYGYGWFLADVPGEERRQFDHGGGDGTRAIAVPADDAMVLYMTHSRGGAHGAAFWNRLYMAGLFAHPGLGLEMNNMVWAEELDVMEVELSTRARARYVGTYLVGEQPIGAPGALRVWEKGSHLHLRVGRPGASADKRFHLVPLGDHRFAVGRYQDGHLKAVDPLYRVRFIVQDGVVSALTIMQDDRVQLSAERER
jgi:CubicO group peptidase (beta-lactamase class C family)